MNIYEKLLEIQKGLKPLGKDQRVEFGNTKYKYYDINQVLSALKPLLDATGVLILQPLDNVNGVPSIKTIIKFEDETLEFNAVIPNVSDPQKQGAIITYFRRYCLVSLFLMESEDDDAQKAIDFSKEIKSFIKENNLDKDESKTVIKAILQEHGSLNEAAYKGFKKYWGVK